MLLAIVGAIALLQEPYKHMDLMAWGVLDLIAIAALMSFNDTLLAALLTSRVFLHIICALDSIPIEAHHKYANGIFILCLLTVFYRSLPSQQRLA